MSNDTIKPSTVVGHGLSETSIKHGLLGNDHATGDNEISKGKSVVDKVLFALELGVEDLGVGLNLVHGFGESSLLN